MINEYSVDDCCEPAPKKDSKTSLLQELDKDFDVALDTLDSLLYGLEMMLEPYSADPSTNTKPSPDEGPTPYASVHERVLREKIQIINSQNIRLGALRSRLNL
jgi:hypothetical protein